MLRVLIGMSVAAIAIANPAATVAIGGILLAGNLAKDLKKADVSGDVDFDVFADEESEEED